MTTWLLEEPDKLAFDEVQRVLVRIVEGAVGVVGSDDRPTLEVSELRGAPLRVRREGGTLTIDYERPWRPGALAWLTGRGQRHRAVLSLAVPRDCPVELRTVTASLMVGGLQAPVQARTISGEITLAGLRGQVEAETVSGPVQASGVTGDLSAHTVSGDLTVAEGGGGSVLARTVSGAIALDLQASGERDIRLSSVSGDLTVRLPEPSDLDVKLQSTSGQVASAFEGLEHERGPGRRAARGRLGRGGGRLRATSTTGHVALLRRAPEVSL
jgi:Putative adhesin